MYSKVTVALFVKTFSKLVSHMPAAYEPDPSIIQAYHARFEGFFINSHVVLGSDSALEEEKESRIASKIMTGDE
jgi:hypothetical protein